MQKWISARPTLDSYKWSLILEFSLFLYHYHHHHHRRRRHHHHHRHSRRRSRRRLIAIVIVIVVIILIIIIIIIIRQMVRRRLCSETFLRPTGCPLSCLLPPTLSARWCGMRQTSTR